MATAGHARAILLAAAAVGAVVTGAAVVGMAQSVKPPPVAAFAAAPLPAQIEPIVPPLTRQPAQVPVAARPVGALPAKTAANAKTPTCKAGERLMPKTKACEPIAKAPAKATAKTAKSKAPANKRG